MGTTTTWVARDRVSGAYFKEWCGIGPLCTRDIAEAARFASREEADAIYHALCGFEPVEAPARPAGPQEA